MPKSSAYVWIRTCDPTSGVSMRVCCWRGREVLRLAERESAVSAGDDAALAVANLPSTSPAPGPASSVHETAARGLWDVWDVDGSRIDGIYRLYSLKRLRHTHPFSTISQHEALALGTTLQNTDLAVSETKRGALPLASPLPVLVDEVDRAGKLRLCDAQTRSAQVGSAISVWQRAQNAVLNGREYVPRLPRRQRCHRAKG